MNWAELPAKLKAYISILSVIGTGISIWAVWDIFVHPPPDNGWIVLTVLVVFFTVPFSLFLESVSTAVGIGDAYIMAIGMMYGVAPCIFATFCQSFLISLFGQRTRRYVYRIFFNTASTVCGAWLYSKAYHLLNRTGSSNFSDIIVPATVLVVTYFFVNSILTSVAIAWSSGQNIVKFWANSCMPLAVDYSVSALCATALTALRHVNQAIPLGAAPAILILWAWNKYHKARHMQTEKHLWEQEQLYLRTVESLALAVDAKDQTTYGHIRRVKVYAMGLAKLCGIKDPEELKAIETGSLLHDIGKLAIDDYILNKPGRLSKKEFEKIKVHATAGDEILQQVRFPFPVAKYVRYHHERWDGLGYPDGLKGEDIPLGARILAISDAFDAIRFSRPYKLPVAKDEAAEILRNQAGIVYDPHLVQLFTRHIDELDEQAIKESETAPKLSFRKYFECIDNADAIFAQSSIIPRDIPAELVQLAEFCTTISGYLHLNDVLPVLSQRLQRLVPYSTCAFYIMGNGDDRIAAMHVNGKFSELIRGHVMEIGKGISGWVAAYRRPMINTGPALDFQGIDGEFTSFTDALVVPIVKEDECLGTLSLYAQQPISYGQNDLAIMQMVASLLAPLIAEAVKNKAQDTQDVNDPITGLNRISYLTAIAPQLIAMAAENRTPVSLIYVEVRNLAQIIRSFGSSLGNSVLKRIADSIKPEFRETDVLVRYGQQGFAAFLPGVRDDQALRCVQRLKQRIRSEAVTPGQGFSVDCQTGVSFYPRDGSTILALLQSSQENMRASLAEKTASERNVVDFYRA
jgi:diguanylate cyclase (GGDEF)-like protein/putative nucleotidyltransferase with HDIG domain